MRSVQRILAIAILASAAPSVSAAPVRDGAWVMAIGAVSSPTILAYLSISDDGKGSISFSYGEHRLRIPLQVSASPANPKVTILSGSTQVTKKQHRYSGSIVVDNSEIRLVAFYAECSDPDTGSGKLVIISSKMDESTSRLGMRSLPSLIREADELTAAQGGAGEPATRSESDTEGGGQFQPESEGHSR